MHSALPAGACIDLSMSPASHVTIAARHCALATQQPGSYHQHRRCCKQPHCKSRPEQRHLLHQRVRRQRSVPLAKQSIIYAGSAQASKVSQNAIRRAHALHSQSPWYPTHRISKTRRTAPGDEVTGAMSCWLRWESEPSRWGGEAWRPAPHTPACCAEPVMAGLVQVEEEAVGRSGSRCQPRRGGGRAGMGASDY